MARVDWRVQNSLLKRGQAVPEEMMTRLTAVESRLAARQQSEVTASEAGAGSGDTTLKDKVDCINICSRCVACKWAEAVADETKETGQRVLTTY